jgi:hypothetical protein
VAVYKVIQDIEAEDKLLGPLSFKGLVYAGVAALLAFINFKLLVLSSLGPVRWGLIFVLLMPMGLFGVLASPLGRDQPTEVWLLSRIRFFLKPRQRVWNQTGLSQLVTVTVPKKIERQLTKNFSEQEARSRLTALATTLDSRGWAVKHVNVNLNAYSDYLSVEDETTDRLIDTSTMAQDVPTVDVRASDDILDEKNNPTAQKFQNLINQADSTRKQVLKEKVNPIKALPFLQQDAPTYDAGKQSLHGLHPMVGFGKNSRAVGNAKTTKTPTDNRVTEANQAAKLELAQSGNDLSVASIARLANRGPANEVVVSLH